MSVDTPPEPERSPVLLRREALLPNERNRGLGTVAVVCTMAGVASGLALATTLMAMQVADSMSVRTCPYRIVATDVQAYEPRSEQGFLGVRYTFRNGAAEVLEVLPGTPAETIQLRRGDHLLSVDGAPVRSLSDLELRLRGMRPGSQPSLLVERNGDYETVRPTLAALPASRY